MMVVILLFSKTVSVSGDNSRSQIDYLDTRTLNLFCL